MMMVLAMLMRMMRMGMRMGFHPGFRPHVASRQDVKIKQVRAHKKASFDGVQRGVSEDGVHP